MSGGPTPLVSPCVKCHKLLFLLCNKFVSASLCAAAESNEGQLTSLFHLSLWSHVAVCLDDSQIMMEYYHAKYHAFTSTGLGQYRRCRHVCYTLHVERDVEVGVLVMQCGNQCV